MGRARAARLGAAAALAAAAAAGAGASSGDRQWAFRECAARCERGDAEGRHCARHPMWESLPGLLGGGGGGGGEDEDGALAGPALEWGCAQAACAGVGGEGGPEEGWRELPGRLHGALWPCHRECAYLCMHGVETFRRDMHRSPLLHEGGLDAGVRGQGEAFVAQKYFGKWPFRRLFGLQEAASSIFSLANGGAHALGLRRFLVLFEEPANRLAYPWWVLWVAYGLLNCGMWLCSACFHAYDCPLTEALDYGSVIFVFSFSSLVACARAAGPEPRQWAPFGALFAVAAAAYAWRQFGGGAGGDGFDYGLNTQVLLAVALGNSALWLAWGRAARHPAQPLLLRFHAVIWAASVFELWDFPALLGVLDAHAVWHALTPPAVLMWWGFVAADAGVEHRRARSRDGKAAKTD